MPNLSVEKLVISHFRSHRALEIPCDPRPVAIYGANGAGKTNILEAVSLLSPGMVCVVQLLLRWFENPKI